MSPEMELAMGIMGSMGMFHFKKKFMPRFGVGGGGLPNMSGFMPPPPTRPAGNRSTITEDSDEEDLPANFR